MAAAEATNKSLVGVKKTFEDVEATKKSNFTMMSNMGVNEQGLASYMESLTTQLREESDLHQRLVAIEKRYDEVEAKRAEMQDVQIGLIAQYKPLLRRHGIKAADLKKGLTLEQLQFINTDLDREKACQAELAKFKSLNEEARNIREQIRDAVEASGRKIPAELFQMDTSELHDFLHSTQTDIQGKIEFCKKEGYNVARTYAQFQRALNTLDAQYRRIMDVKADDVNSWTCHTLVRDYYKKNLETARMIKQNHEPFTPLERVNIMAKTMVDTLKDAAVGHSVEGVLVQFADALDAIQPWNETTTEGFKRVSSCVADTIRDYAKRGEDLDYTFNAEMLQAIESGQSPLDKTGFTSDIAMNMIFAELEKIPITWYNFASQRKPNGRLEDQEFRPSIFWYDGLPQEEEDYE